MNALPGNFGELVLSGAAMEIPDEFEITLDDAMAYSVATVEFKSRMDELEHLANALLKRGFDVYKDVYKDSGEMDFKTVWRFAKRKAVRSEKVYPRSYLAHGNWMGVRMEQLQEMEVGK